MMNSNYGPHAVGIRSETGMPQKTLDEHSSFLWSGVQPYQGIFLMAKLALEEVSISGEESRVS